MELAQPDIPEYDFMSASINQHSLGDELVTAWNNAIPIRYDYGLNAVDVARALINMSNITVGKVPHIDKMAAEARKMLHVEAPEELATIDVVFGYPNEESDRPMG
jgi:hypothetical protein